MYRQRQSIYKGPLLRQPTSVFRRLNAVPSIRKRSPLLSHNSGFERSTRSKRPLLMKPESSRYSYIGSYKPKRSHLIDDDRYSTLRSKTSNRVTAIRASSSKPSGNADTLVINKSIQTAITSVLRKTSSAVLQPLYLATILNTTLMQYKFSSSRIENEMNNAMKLLQRQSLSLKKSDIPLIKLLVKPAWVSEQLKKATAEDSFLKCAKCMYAFSKVPLVCKSCDEKFFTVPDLYLHQAKTHSIDDFDSQLECTLCNIDKMSPQKYHKHMNENHFCHSLHIRCPFQCDSLLNSESLFMHIEKTHAFYCKECRCQIYSASSEHTHVLQSSVPSVDGEVVPAKRIKTEAMKITVTNTNINSSPNRKVIAAAKTSSKNFKPIVFEDSCEKEKEDKATVITVNEISEKQTIVKNELTKSLCSSCKWNSPGTRFSCNICPCVFPFKEFLDLHIGVRHRGRNREVKCGYCNVLFKSVESLAAHYVSSEKICEWHVKCNVTDCNNLCTSLVELKKHYSVTHKQVLSLDDQEKISIIDIRSDRSHDVNEIRNKYFKSSVIGKNLNCVKCKLVYMQHSYTCLYCVKKFSTHHDVVMHQLIVHQCKEDFNCILCNKKFTGKLRSSYPEHLLSFHALCKDHYFCFSVQCTTLLSCTSTLFRHFRIAHSNLYSLAKILLEQPCTSLNYSPATTTEDPVLNLDECDFIVKDEVNSDHESIISDESVTDIRSGDEFQDPLDYDDEDLDQISIEQKDEDPDFNSFMQEIDEISENIGVSCPSCSEKFKEYRDLCAHLMNAHIK